MQTPRTEFAQALKAIATERGLDASVILDTIKQAIVAAYKRDARERGEETETFDYDVELDPVNGEARVFAWPGANEEEGIEAKPDEKKDVTPPGFGRIAAQTAKQVIHQKIKEAEKDAIMSEYSDRVGGLISGMILRFDGPNVRVDLGRTEGMMPAEERVPSERLNPNQRLSFLLKAIEDGIKGKRIVLSRADAKFVHKLFEREVPEISSGGVEVRALAREAGVRTKIAVASSQPGVDPVGSCVGQKGVRVQAVTNELGGERVDIVPWNDDEVEFIKASLSPAENLEVELDKENKMAIVTAPSDQLSLAIGKEGQNARLSSKLTGWKIEVKEDEKTAKARKESKEAEEEKKEVRTKEALKEEKENKDLKDEAKVEKVSDEVPDKVENEASKEPSEVKEDSNDSQTENEDKKEADAV